MYRLLLVCLTLLATLSTPPALAAGGSLSLGINEGTSSSLDALFLRQKYAAFASHLGTAAGKPVRLETSNVLPILVRNIGKSKYDVLLVRPSHISAQAMRDHGYRLLVTAKGESKLHFLVRGDSPLRTLEDVRGKRIAIPNDLAYPSQLAQAVLRDAGLKDERSHILVMDRQDAVSYAVREGMADVGVVMSYSRPAADWQGLGGRFLYTKEGLPYWSVIVSNQVSEAEANRLRDALLALGKTPKGQGILREIGIEAFQPGTQQPYLDMLAWVEGRKRLQ